MTVCRKLLLIFSNKNFEKNKRLNTGRFWIKVWFLLVSRGSTTLALRLVGTVSVSCKWQIDHIQYCRSLRWFFKNIISDIRMIIFPLKCGPRDTRLSSKLKPIQIMSQERKFQNVSISFTKYERGRQVINVCFWPSLASVSK